MINKIFVFLVILSIYSLFTPKQAIAQLILNEDFSDGDASGWSIPRNTCASTWTVASYKYGINTNGCITETIPNITIQENQNYIFEVEMSMPNSLNDRNFVFKYKDSNNWYGIHTYQNTFYVQKVVNGTEYFLDNWIGNYNFTPGGTYTFKIIAISNTSYDVYINDNLQLTVPDKIPFFQNHTAGLQASGNSQVWFDNVKITLIPDTTPSPTPTIVVTPSPSPSPTASPTASPTPVPTATPTIEPTTSPTSTPVLPVLSVPSLKQYSTPWGNKIYDHTKNTIHEFGCALTSAVMVLQYHGHIVLPDTLNNWLNSQSDGYIRNGLINWLAVSRYTKLHDSTNSPTLEYKRLEPTKGDLDNELNNNRPAILKENGHFVVATGKTNNSYLINDPGYASRNTLEPYGNTYLAINSYTPTHSDLSYMMFVVDSDINIEIKDSNGLLIPTESYIDEPINGLTNPNIKSGETVKIILFEKPETGDYKLLVSGPKGKYQLNSYLYDVSGNVNQNKFNGEIKSNETDKYNISFSSEKEKVKKSKKILEVLYWHKFFSKFFEKHS